MKRLIFLLILYTCIVYSQTKLQSKLDGICSMSFPSTSFSQSDWEEIKSEFIAYTRDSDLYQSLNGALSDFCKYVSKYTNRSPSPSEVLMLSDAGIEVLYLEASTANLTAQREALDNNQTDRLMVLNADYRGLESSKSTIVNSAPQLSARFIRILPTPSSDPQDTSISISSLSKSEKLPSLSLSDSWRLNMYILRYAKAFSSENSYSDYLLWRRTDGLIDYGPVHFGFNYSVLHYRSYDKDSGDTKSTFSLGSIGAQFSLPILTRHWDDLSFDISKKQIVKERTTVPILTVRVYGGPWIGSFPSGESFTFIGNFEVTSQLDFSFDLGIIRPMISAGITLDKIGAIPFLAICGGGGDERILRNLRMKFPK